MNRVIIAFVAILFVAIGCSIPSNPFAIDGSRADGKVIMHSGATTDTADKVNWKSQEYAAFEKCLAWGYQGVEPFGGVRSSIITTSQWGQNIWEHERVYQCTTSSRAPSVREPASDMP